MSNKLNDELKNSLIVWSLNSTCHGLSNIVRSKIWIIKIMWTICFLVSATYCFHEVVVVIKMYLRYPVLVDIQLIHESPTIFPAITLCNLNQFNPTRSKYLTDRIINKHNLTFGNENAVEYTQKVSEQLKLEIKYMNLNESELKSLGYTIDEMLLSCSFNQIKCDLNEFEWFYDYNLGNCYTYNNQKSLFNNLSFKEINKGGINHGLQLELYVGDTNATKYTSRSGIQLTIHNQSLLPDSDDGLYISTGFETNVLIDRLFMYKLDSPYSSCIKNIVGKSTSISGLYKDAIANTRHSFGEYNQKYCIKLCYQNYVETSCNCSVASLPRINSKLKICYNKRELNCMIDRRDIFYSKHVYNICNLYCPLECDSIKYISITSTAQYPSQWYSKLLKQYKQLIKTNNDNYEIIKMNTLKMNIFYDDLVFTVSNELPAIRVQDELAKIGGQFGLFIGISFLSMVELLEILFEIIILLFNHFRKSFISQKTL